MRQIILTFVILASATSAHATLRQDGRLGIGLGAGTLATGLSMKYITTMPVSIQANLGWWRASYYCHKNSLCYRTGGSGAISGDLLFEQPVIVENEHVALAWALGGSVGLGFDNRSNDVGLEVAFVIGLELLINAVPIDVVVEYRPGFFMVPEFAIDFVNVTGHARYYF